jgi:signal transduction histidine kinase
VRLQLRVFLALALHLLFSLVLAWALTTGAILRPFFLRMSDERADLAVYIAEQIEAAEAPREAGERLSRELSVQLEPLPELPPHERRGLRILDRRGRRVAMLRGPGAPVAVQVEVGFRGPHWLLVRFDSDLEEPPRRVGWVLLVVAATSLGAAWFTVRLAFRPLSVAKAAMNRVAAGELSHRVPETTAVGEVARTFNHMAAQVEQLVRGQRELMAAVSHELRTPLSRLRLQVEMLREAGGDSRRMSAMEADLGEVDGLVEELLESARLRQGVIALRPSRLVVEELLTDVLGRVDLGERTIELVVSPGLEVVADRERLIRAMTNLLTNVRKYTPDDASVSVGGDRSPGESCVVLWVDDGGPGVPDRLKERLFEPFFRVNRENARAVGGLGLGLMLVRQIAEAHGGNAGVGRSRLGGLRVEVRLPVEVAQGLPADSRLG